eukprot:CAMPEP_0116542414 /NCGR_PEP_ID=MMETSP0397-20121206/1005_1 /TAXON_ID=216820 /ORGANISM="Cyclophora tenuis, Strain ECT3854" /LENGTH=190 /DNA_ID=CAMNT_0004066425 /DNA_START=67 /DNA_END=639 /DNA_ORIENTATION=-
MTVVYQILLVVALFLPIGIAGADKISTDHNDHSRGGACTTEDDVDFEDCWMHELDIPELDAICQRVGLNATTDVFPFLEELDTDDDDDDHDKTRPSHHDYVTAAYECLMIEQDVQLMLHDYNLFPPDLSDRRGQALVLQDVLDREPLLLKQLEEELQQRAPELWTKMQNELNGKALNARSFSSLLLQGQR